MWCDWSHMCRKSRATVFSPSNYYSWVWDIKTKIKTKATPKSGIRDITQFMYKNVVVKQTQCDILFVEKTWKCVMYFFQILD